VNFSDPNLVRHRPRNFTGDYSLQIAPLALACRPINFKTSHKVQTLHFQEIKLKLRPVRGDIPFQLHLIPSSLSKLARFLRHGVYVSQLTELTAIKC